MKQNTLKNREGNYDLLRIISTIAVIVVHVSSTYKAALYSGDRFGDFHTDSMIAIVLYNMLTRFCVPCFLMISGAFLLSDDRNADFKYFYRKSFRSVIMQTMIFSFVFLAYNELVEALKYINGEPSELFKPVLNLLIGQPGYHLWYVYTLAGIYVIIPLILRLKNCVSEKTFQKISWIYLIVATASGWTSTFKLEWGISKVACYVGFIFAGYQLKKLSLKKNNLQGALLIASGLLSQLIIAYVQYLHVLEGINEPDEKISLISSLNPIIVLGSVLIFAGFSKLDVKKCRFGNLPRLTLYIYMFHIMVWDVLRALYYKFMGCLPKAEIFIPISTAVIFIVSYVLAFVYDKVWKAFDKRFSITDKACRLLRLN